MTPRASLVLLLLVACRSKAADLPVCLADVGSERAVEADTRVLPPRVWFQLLVPRISLPDLRPPDDPRECSGRQIPVTWPDVAANTASAEFAEALARRQLTEEDLTFGEGPDNTLLIWARIAFFADGTAMGPVALARWTARGLEIRGIGSLRAPPRRPRLRLETLGSDAQVLVADAELCPSGPAVAGKPPRCRREVYLLPLVEQRFVQTELVVEDGTSLGPARIYTYEQHDAPQRDGWIRRSEVQRSLRFKDAHVTIGEAIRIRDCDPKTNLDVCDEHEAIHGEQMLEWRDGRFVTTARSTWNEVIAR